jgi:UDP-N-acetyl-D-galactosamine dehydrogenase
MFGIIGLFHTRATRTAAEQTIPNMIASGSNVSGALANVPGPTVKDSCGDLRNSKVIDIIHKLERCRVGTFVSDPQADPEEAMHEYGVRLDRWDDLPRADGIVAAVAHREYMQLCIEEIGKKLVKGGAFGDVKAAFPSQVVKRSGHRLWRL